MFMTIYVTVVLILAAIYYVYQIINDAFLVKDGKELIQKPEDEDVDISDEAGQFEPILIEKETDDDGGKKAKPRKKRKPKAKKNADGTGDGDKTDGKQETAQVDNKASDEPSNRKSLSDLDSKPKAMDKATQSRIDDLVGRLRKGEDIGIDDKSDIDNPDETISSQGDKGVAPSTDSDGNISDKSGSKTESREKSRSDSEQIKEVQPKLPKGSLKEEQETIEKVKSEPQHEIAVFELRFYPDDDAALSNHCDGQTAEETQTEAVEVSKDKEKMALKAMESDWEFLDGTLKAEEAARALAEQKQSGGSQKSIATFGGLEEQ